MLSEQLIQRSLQLLEAHQTVSDAIALLPQTPEGCFGVVRQGVFQGIITEREILQAVLTGRSPEAISVMDIRLQDVPTLQVSELADFPSILRHVELSRCVCLPILDDRKSVVGYLTPAQLLESVGSTQQQALATQVQLQQQVADLNRSNVDYQNEIAMLQLLEENLRNSELVVRQSQERLDNILSSIEDVVWSVTPGTFQLLYVNTATEQVFGRGIPDFLQNLNFWFEMVHPGDRPQVEQAYDALYHTFRQEIEYRIIWPDLSVRWVRTRMHLVLDEAQKPVRIDGITTDITERQAIQEQLRHDALHDGLTGLANRNLLSDRLEQAFKRYQRQSDRHFALLFLDLDRFKVINDSLGHQIGDQLLIAVARKLEQCQRTKDTIARLGGDEFVILLEDLEARDIVFVVAERIHDMLKNPFEIEGHEIVLTTSIGIAFGMPHLSMEHNTHNAVSNLLRDADIAMYRAKSKGQGRHAVFDLSMHTDALKQLQVETDLRRVLANVQWDSDEQQELQVNYQPIFALDTLNLQGFEALVRWHHPEKGAISPADFIPVAEETGLIVGLDQWVITAACRQLRHWHQQFPHLNHLFISANLSGRHFEQSGLIEFLDQLLQETQLSPNALKLEITETTLIKNPKMTGIILDQLRTRQIQTCLDDFGTGYSSLSYLQKFPFHFIKIDQSFVQQLGHTPHNQTKNAIVQAIVTLGDTLGMGTVAEGVEKAEQIAQLQSLKCAYGQGYFFAKPMSAEAAADFLKLDAPPAD
jgi:diguanylate cyclase (GGDEF)-like protein/PAS domain S-box-containing protein